MTMPHGLEVARPGAVAATAPPTPEDGLVIDVAHRLGTLSLEVALTLPTRGITALFGASGSGKTSLLRLIAGLDRPARGVIRIGDTTLADADRGIHVPVHRRRLGVVFQEARLFPHYRVRGNLTYGMRPGMQARFDTLVELLGIGHLLQRFPGTLSGGEARRVAIGRALLTDPRLLLMDEPLTGLDEARKRELLRYIARLAEEVETPILYVSHDPQEIAAIAERMVIIEAGRVVAQDRLEALLMRFDLTERLGGFEALNRIEARVAAHDDAYGLTRLALEDGQALVVPRLDAEPGQRLRLRVPVRDVALALAPLGRSSYRNRLEAVIEEAVRLPGDVTAMEVRLRLGEQRLRARLTRKSFDELALGVGVPVVALLRSVAFDAQRA